MVCSAGVGRSGTFIALDSLLQQAESEGKIDVYSYVTQMRKQRCNMIQTLVCRYTCIHGHMYFIHCILRTYLLSDLMLCTYIVHSHVFIRTTLHVYLP